MNALSLDSVSHSFKQRRVLDAVSFSVAQGRVCILLGRNGAGKTTLFSLVTGLYHARFGSVQVFGHAMRTDPAAALAAMGVVFQQQTLDLDLTTAENLRYHAALHGLAAEVAEARMREELGRLAVLDRLHDPVRSLSGGQRRRVEIARALMHRPRILLLDEPTTGLDVPGRQALAHHLHGLCRERGIAALWATHFLEEVTPEDDVVVLHAGRVQWAGGADRIEAELGVASMTDAFAKLTAAA
ncbi:ATP-binding cassette domain-containing protein [Mesorhizobium sp. M0051]|uniref:ATP-binding cassette domain-containing protein n=1 Tax=Mesorhizobium sp. M0051 TaxID=2956862 RepID=UPI0033370BA9